MTSGLRKNNSVEGGCRRFEDHKPDSITLLLPPGDNISSSKKHQLLKLCAKKSVRPKCCIAVLMPLAVFLWQFAALYNQATSLPSEKRSLVCVINLVYPKDWHTQELNDESISIIKASPGYHLQYGSCSRFCKTLCNNATTFNLDNCAQSQYEASSECCAGKKSSFKQFRQLLKTGDTCSVTNYCCPFENECLLLGEDTSIFDIGADKKGVCRRRKCIPGYFCDVDGDCCGDGEKCHNNNETITKWRALMASADEPTSDLPKCLHHSFGSFGGQRWQSHFVALVVLSGALMLATVWECVPHEASGQCERLPTEHAWNCFEAHSLDQLPDRFYGGKYRSRMSETKAVKHVLSC